MPCTLPRVYMTTKSYMYMYMYPRVYMLVVSLKPTLQPNTEHYFIDIQLHKGKIQ